MTDFQKATLLLGRGRGKKRLEVQGMISELRSDTKCDGYPLRYSLRHGDNGNYSSIELFVYVNWMGYFFVKEALPMGKDGLPIRDYWFED